MQLTTADRVGELRRQRRAFVVATVVHAERPTSASPGDTALIHPDGTIEGFVGGSCAETSVRTQALDCLVRRETVVLRITPDDRLGDPDPIGRVTVVNPCLSGGTLEIFLEPDVPDPLVHVIGSGPIALALEALGPAVGFEVRRGDGLAAVDADTEGVVVASHGRNEEAALRVALGADGVSYIGLVASRRRGAAVVASLDGEGIDTSRVATPAGLDIGARTPAEVALSILAQIISIRPRTPSGPAATADAPAPSVAVATDPICGMSVAMVASSLSIDHHGTTSWFCGSGCLDAFAADPSRYV